ncbi:Uncharacterized conserved protein [Phaffia rhodozyma]|uniref:Uncharacterized conserved protein n=1 Tax=Phaffia rhodozyma TaxID=264483 RepID=A0A0F7SWR4_PHARH|nr:Uncharacterized conserved protein [Phaffia rhodozyma]
MVKLTLLLKATLDNVTSLEPASDQHEFYLKVQCSSCHEVHPNHVPVNMQEEHELSSGRGTASFVWKCSFCKREASLSFLPPQPPSQGVYAPKNKKNIKIPFSNKPLPIVESDTWTVFLTVECRGLEAVGFDWEGTWRCGVPDRETTFEDVVFEDGRWDEYDEESAAPCSIEELESQWVKV